MWSLHALHSFKQIAAQSPDCYHAPMNMLNGTPSTFPIPCTVTNTPLGLQDIQSGNRQAASREFLHSAMHSAASGLYAVQLRLRGAHGGALRGERLALQ
jgi:hypothetical protein